MCYVYLKKKSVVFISKKKKFYVTVFVYTLKEFPALKIYFLCIDSLLYLSFILDGVTVLYHCILK